METAQVMPIWQAIFSGLVGLTYVLAGYRTMRFTARMTSAVLFMGLGLIAAPHVQHPAIVAAILLGAAVIGFLLGNAFYYVNMALFGGGAGVVLAAVISAATGHSLGWPAGIAGAAAGSVLAILFERRIGIFGTSVIGAALSLMALQMPVGNVGNEVPEQTGWSVAFFLGLTVLGCVFQGRMTRNLPPHQGNANCKVRAKQV